jgi:hypothetical protein
MVKYCEVVVGLLVEGNRKMSTCGDSLKERKGLYTLCKSEVLSVEDVEK